MSLQPLLVIPPFPHARLPRFAAPCEDDDKGGSLDVEAVLSALAHHRVGGTYWGKQEPIQLSGLMLDGTAHPLPDRVPLKGDTDPWPLLDIAETARFPENDPLAILALAARVPLTLVTASGVERGAGPDDAERLIRAHLADWRWYCPFSGAELPLIDAISLCGSWRRLIDANRSIYSVLGLAKWKKPTVTPLLWAGAPVPYGEKLAEMPQGKTAAIWRTRIAKSEARALAATKAAVIEIEDGFIRSSGLGADCVPPLSIIVDARRPHFDPSAPSELERLLQYETFSVDLVERARRLRETIVVGGLSKYETASADPLPRPVGAKHLVLVPGQVEDDRAVTSGGALPSNLELLRRARAEAGPDAYIIYKPHPDVLAGHRKGKIAEADVVRFADEVNSTSPMAALIAMVDELHVNTSLAGFEALMRNKPVTVHGVPFYAGWGLTIDRGPVPARRSAKRTLDELVAACLLLYPRYLDPVTGLPCQAEVLVGRLSGSGQHLDAGAAAIVAFRRTVGRISRALQA